MPASGLTSPSWGLMTPMPCDDGSLSTCPYRFNVSTPLAFEGRAEDQACANLWTVQVGGPRAQLQRTGSWQPRGRQLVGMWTTPPQMHKTLQDRALRGADSQGPAQTGLENVRELPTGCPRWSNRDTRLRSSCRGCLSSCFGGGGRSGEAGQTGVEVARGPARAKETVRSGCGGWGGQGTEMPLEGEPGEGPSVSTQGRPALGLPQV